MERTEHYNYAFLDEGSKREIRRCILKAVAIPGYQVPFGSRELPIGRGWGTGGIQLTLSLIGPSDTLKVIDQGSDDSVNAVNIKKFVGLCTDVPTTTDTHAATLIQSRHRIPEVPLRNDQILVLQVPIPEPLRIVEPKEEVTKKMHAEKGLCSDLAAAVREHCKIRQGDHPDRVSLYGRGPLHHEPQSYPEIRQPKTASVRLPVSLRRRTGEEDLRRAAAH